MHRSGKLARLESALQRALRMAGLALPETGAAQQARALAGATRSELQAFLRALGLAQLAAADWSQVAAGACLACVLE